MNKILETTKFVIENAKYVKINQKAINEFCKVFERSHISHWINHTPFDISNLKDNEKVSFLLIFNSISFSYWGEPKWTIEYKGEKVDGAFGMISALGKAIENKIPILNMKWLANISEDDFEKITKGNTKIPLSNTRLKILREIGQITMKSLDGDFTKLINKAKGDVIKLLDLIILTFPSFNDEVTYKGKKVYFYKRAQLLISDIYQIFKGKGMGNLSNINQLTACADYKLPMVLRKLGILEYSEDLAKKIDNKIEIQKDSEEETEIRASTIWANEFIKEKLRNKIRDIESIHTNDHLWLLGQIKTPKDKPYHLTRTTAY